MLRRKKYKTPKIATVIGNGTTIKGDLIFSGGMHIDGVVQGCVVANSADASALTLSEHGRIDGDVKAPYITLNGQVTGDVYASERVELASKARISGAVYYKILEMMMGAEVNGKLIHTQENVPRKVDQSEDKKRARIAPGTTPGTAPGVVEPKKSPPKVAPSSAPAPKKST